MGVKHHVKNLVVGAGFSGATIANKISCELGEEVLLIDSKPHLGGNCFDFWQDAKGNHSERRLDNAVCVHQYGTHIFHTNLRHVWDYASRFTSWHPYMHKVKGFVDGQFIPIPFNLNSLHQVFPDSLAGRIEKSLIERFGFNCKVPILKLRQTGDKDLTFLATYIYEKIFLNYTVKQWEMKPEELSPEVTGRVPVYVSRDDRYFQDKYQGIPSDGYTALVRRMLSNPLVDIKLNTKFSDIVNDISYDRLFYTGPIDEFFNYEFGELPYRSLRFDFQTLPKEYFQSNSVINYPNNYDFTRIGEYKYFLDDRAPHTVISYEYPQAFVNGKNDRYYPIIREDNQILYQRYAEKAKSLPNVYFLGRLGSYQYFDMDKAIARALEVFEEVKA